MFPEFRVVFRRYSSMRSIKMDVQGKKPEQLSFPNQRMHVENSSTRYPTVQKLVLNGGVAVSQKVSNGLAEQYRAEPLVSRREEDKKVANRYAPQTQINLLELNGMSVLLLRVGQRGSLAEDPAPPPLHPRQMKINQSMRARIPEGRPGNLIRTSPSRDKCREQRPLNYTM